MQAVGGGDSAALRPSLRKAVDEGAESVRRAALMSAEQSKHKACIALLGEVMTDFHLCSV